MNLINNVDGVRFGVMRFNSGGDYGQMVATIGDREIHNDHCRQWH